MLKDLFDSKAIFLFAAGIALTVVALFVEYSMFQECRAHGFSLFYCLMK